MLLRGGSRWSRLSWSSCSSPPAVTQTFTSQLGFYNSVFDASWRQCRSPEVTGTVTVPARAPPRDSGASAAGS